MPGLGSAQIMACIESQRSNKNNLFWLREELRKPLCLSVSNSSSLLQAYFTAVSQQSISTLAVSQLSLIRPSEPKILRLVIEQITGGGI